MSIKEASKRASGESLKGKSLHQSVVHESRIPNPRVQVVTDFMNANLHRGIRLAELAGAANLSPSRFSHLFKTQTGLSPGEYLRRLRMENARHLLATTLLSIKEIMAMVGYNSKSHFVRHFRRSFGLSPSGYRKSVSSSY
jgi:transcriptional regulator GlxA family with amidase domain